MSRFAQKVGERGSLKWIQRAIDERWQSLELPILAQIRKASRIEWRSPLAQDDYAEYRDCAFLDRLGLYALDEPLTQFWPARGPQWDALGRTDNGAVLLVEAKAHIGEMCTTGTAAGPTSRQIIEDRLMACATRLGARSNGSSWAETFYQLANRLAHLQFLRDHGVDAYLVLVNFVGDKDISGPKTQEAWVAAYQVAFYAMGVKQRNALSRYIIDVFPEVTAEV